MENVGDEDAEHDYACSGYQHSFVGPHHGEEGDDSDYGISVGQRQWMSHGAGFGGRGREQQHFYFVVSFQFCRYPDVLGTFGGFDAEALAGALGDFLHGAPGNRHRRTFLLRAGDLHVVDGELVGFDGVPLYPPRASDDVPEDERDQECVRDEDGNQVPCSAELSGGHHDERHDEQDQDGERYATDQDAVGVLVGGCGRESVGFGQAAKVHQPRSWHAAKLCSQNRRR